MNEPNQQNILPFAILLSGKNRVYLLVVLQILLLRIDQPSQSLMITKHSSNTVASENS